MSSVDARREQAFPILQPDEIAHIRRFAKPRRYAAGERVYSTGKTTSGLHVVLSGLIRVTGRDGHGRDLPSSITSPAPSRASSGCSPGAVRWSMRLR